MFLCDIERYIRYYCNNSRRISKPMTLLSMKHSSSNVYASLNSALGILKPIAFETNSRYLFSSKCFVSPQGNFAESSNLKHVLGRLC